MVNMFKSLYFSQYEYGKAFILVSLFLSWPIISNMLRVIKLLKIKCIDFKVVDYEGYQLQPFKTALSTLPG